MGFAPDSKLGLQVMMSCGHLIIDDDAMWPQMVSSLVCTLICRVLLVAALLRVWFYYRI